MLRWRWRRTFRVCLAVSGAAVLAGAVATSVLAAPRTIVAPRGQPVEIALVLDRTADYAAGVENAVRMAVQSVGSIRGQAIQVDDYAAPCTGDISDVPANLATAQSIVANPRIVAVIGHPCSFSFAGVPSALAPGPCPSPVGPNALALYESAGIPTINGSTTNRCLPPVGPTVLNETAVVDPDFDAWYKSVRSQIPDKLWSTLYTAEFRSPPPEYADLYFDATRLLLARMQQVAAVARAGAGVSISDADLAAAIRHTVDFGGVTCAVTIDPATGNRVKQPVTTLSACIRGS
jgi:ABC-type branched-subunit amino acid transport system substrate-binding protein